MASQPQQPHLQLFISQNNVLFSITKNLIFQMALCLKGCKGFVSLQIT